MPPISRVFELPAAGGGGVLLSGVLLPRSFGFNLNIDCPLRVLKFARSNATIIYDFGVLDETVLSLVS
jgi:hypothetical protein